MKDREKALKEELSKHFFGHGQRLTMMTKLILAVMQMGTVNFAQLALGLNPLVKVASNFKRIQRFVKGYRFCQKHFVHFAWSMYGKKGQWVALTMDRTNWKFGRVNINILTIGISWRGTAIPLVWKLLDKRGNSSVEERVELLDQLWGLLSTEAIKRVRYLLMDREFGSGEWITELKKKKLGFIIRIRTDARIRMPGVSEEKAAKKLFASRQYKALRKQRIVFGHRLFMAGQKLSGKEYLILVSDTRLTHGNRLYAERWGIEVFFGCCKSRGFNFEDTHLRHLDRINTLMFVLAIAFIWAFKTGEWMIENGKRIPIKYVRKRKTKLYSIFRFGLDLIRQLIINNRGIRAQIRLLSCT
jgi:hypothetical protein